MTENKFSPNKTVLDWFAPALARVGEIYNGYEIHGIENVPKGPCLMVFYHGLVPIDFWYFGMKWYQVTGRPICGLVDRFIMKTPGLSWLTRNLGGMVGERKSAEEVLRNGNIVGVSPGGVREAISGNNYKLVWGDRKGFAELALSANVPIIPGFTTNVEDLYRAPGAGSELVNRLYEMTRLPILPIIGLGVLPFPVKLRTYLGPPIHSRQGETGAEYAERTRQAIEHLIANHQKTKNSIVHSILERF